MASPVTPAAAQEAIPSLLLPACSELNKAMEVQPLLRQRLVSYLLDSNGEINTDFATDLCTKLEAMDCFGTTSTTSTSTSTTTATTTAAPASMEVVWYYGVNSMPAPNGYSLVDIQIWGGGGGGGSAARDPAFLYLPPPYFWQLKAGGGGGEFRTITNYPVTPGDDIDGTVGDGGTGSTYVYTRGNSGAASSVTKNGAPVGTANGGGGGLNGQIPYVLPATCNSASYGGTVGAGGSGGSGGVGVNGSNGTQGNECGIGGFGGNAGYVVSGNPGKGGNGSDLTSPGSSGGNGTVGRIRLVFHN